MATILGTSGSNVISGTNDSGDFIFARAGNDLVNANVGNDQVFGERGNDVLNGGSGNDRLNGGLGNDTLNGGAGTDTADYSSGVVDPPGSVGPQTISGATAGVTVNLNIVGAQNTGGAGIDTLVSIENITGSRFNDTLTGNGGNNVLSSMAGNDRLFGGNGHDTLNGGTGADNMNGGEGIDTYIVDNVGDVVQESFDDLDAGVFDRVESSVTYTMGFGIEALTLTGTAAINGSGNGKVNYIDGNSANNVLNGAAGEDIVGGGGGNDIVNGGTENDIVDGGDGNDIVNGGAGEDTVGGADGNDIVNGGAGADTMFGGNGNDTYIVDTVFDSVSEDIGSLGIGDGVDTVKAFVTHSLSFAIENLTLTGSAAINGTGNELNNVITGNGGNNVLLSLAGNDKLAGGSGKDTLTGGAGHDIFIYTSASDSPAGAGRDIIVDFKGNGSAIGDQINLTAIDANTLVSGNQAFTYIGSAAFSAAGQLRYTGSVLQGSTDGDTAAEFEVQLVGTPALVVGGAGTDIIL